MHRCAVHEHFARFGREHACENVEQGTLAAAGRADQRDEFSVLYIHAQVFQNSLLFERDADIFDLRFHGDRSLLDKLVGVLLTGRDGMVDQTVLCLLYTSGATANGFRDGWLGAVYPLANAIGLITVAFCFSHVRKFKFRTLCEELQFYYDGSPYMRKFMSVVIFLVSIVWRCV